MVAPGVGLGSEGRVSWEGFGISGAFIYGGSTVVLGTHFPGTGSFLGEYSELCFVASGICCGMLTVFSGVSVDSLPGILIGISEHPQSANAAKSYPKDDLEFHIGSSPSFKATILQQLGQGNPLFTDTLGLFPHNACNLPLEER